MPEGTTAFNLSVDFAVTSTFQPTLGNPETSPISGNIALIVSPPVFSVSSSGLPITPGGLATVALTAAIPNSTQGLAWVASNIPPWLTLSQTSGSSSSRVTFSVAPGTAPNTTASVNFQTDPPFAAPSVEQNPLTVQVTVASQPTRASALVAGGVTAGACATNAADVYSTTAGSFIGVGSMNTARRLHTATTLKTGQVLVAGGADGNSNVLATAELYNPLTATFSSTGSMTSPRSVHTATALSNGQVLITGGQDDNDNTLSSAELYNPSSATFASTGAMSSPRLTHTATLLPSDEVLVAGGSTDFEGANPAGDRRAVQPNHARLRAHRSDVHSTRTARGDGHRPGPVSHVRPARGRKVVGRDGLS